MSDDPIFIDDDDDCYIVEPSPTTDHQRQTVQQPTNRPPSTIAQTLQAVLHTRGISMTTVTPARPSIPDHERPSTSRQDHRRVNSNSLQVTVSPDISNLLSGFEEHNFPSTSNNPSCSTTLSNVEQSILAVSQGNFSNAEYQNRQGFHSKKKAIAIKKKSIKLKKNTEKVLNNAMKQDDINTARTCFATIVRHLIKLRKANDGKSVRLVIKTKASKINKQTLKKNNVKSHPKGKSNSKTKLNKTTIHFRRPTGHRQFPSTNIASSCRQQASRYSNLSISRQITEDMINPSLNLKKSQVQAKRTQIMKKKPSNIANLKQITQTMNNVSISNSLQPQQVQNNSSQRMAQMLSILANNPALSQIVSETLNTQEHQNSKPVVKPSSQVIPNGAQSNPIHGVLPIPSTVETSKKSPLTENIIKPPIRLHENTSVTDHVQQEEIIRVQSINGTPQKRQTNDTVQQASTHRQSNKFSTNQVSGVTKPPSSTQKQRQLKENVKKITNLAQEVFSGPSTMQNSKSLQVKKTVAKPAVSLHRIKTQTNQVQRMSQMSSTIGNSENNIHNVALANPSLSMDSNQIRNGNVQEPSQTQSSMSSPMKHSLQPRKDQNNQIKESVRVTTTSANSKKTHVGETMIFPSTSQQPDIIQMNQLPGTVQTATTIGSTKEHILSIDRFTNPTPESPNGVHANLGDQITAALPTQDNSGSNMNVLDHIGTRINLESHLTTSMNIAHGSFNGEHFLNQEQQYPINLALQTIHLNHPVSDEFAKQFSTAFRRVFNVPTEVKILKMGDIMLVMKGEFDALKLRVGNSKNLLESRIQDQEQLQAHAAYERALKRNRTLFGNCLDQICKKLEGYDVKQQKAQFFAWFVKIHLLAVRVLKTDYPGSYCEGRETIKGFLPEKCLKNALVQYFLTLKDKDLEEKCQKVLALMNDLNCV